MCGQSVYTLKRSWRCLVKTAFWLGKSKRTEARLSWRMARFFSLEATYQNL
jgi:hypothetical protein